MFMKKKNSLSFLGFSIMELIVSFTVVAVIVGATTPIMFKKSSKMKLKGLSAVTTNCDVSNPACSLFLEPGTSENRCQVFKKRVEGGVVSYTCALCKTKFVNNCKQQNRYFDNETCQCFSCSDKFNAMVNPACTDCCIRCNRDYCTGCNIGVGLQDRSKEAHMGCRVCDKGKYSNNKNNTGVIDIAQACKPCPKECYCPYTRMGELKNTGKNSLDVSGVLSCPTDSSGNTYPCELGYYCPGGTSNYTIHPCPKGKYKDVYGGSSEASCKLCPTGYKCPNEHMTIPEVCGYGFYQDQTGQISCKDCKGVLLNSTTKTPTATSSTQCVCPDGTYKVKGSPLNICTTCGPKTFKRLVAGSTDVYECPPCPEGVYCPGDGSKYQCPCGTYSKGSVASCGGCTALNQYSTAGATSCSACSSGVSTPNSCGCCPSNCSTCDNSKCCTKCDSGYHVENCKCVLTCAVSNCNTCKSGDINKCKTCASGYTLKSDGKCCLKITQAQKNKCANKNAVYIQTDDYGCKGICLKTKDVSIASDVTGLTVGGSSCASYSSKCCWTGKISTALTGTLCNANGAKANCSAIGWRLPTLSEMQKFTADDAKVPTAGSNVFGCNGSTFYTDVDTQYNVCANHVTWGNGAEMIFSDPYAYSEIGSAFSVRCVIDVTKL